MQVIAKSMTEKQDQNHRNDQNLDSLYPGAVPSDSGTAEINGGSILAELGSRNAASESWMLL